ncbi:MAG TPA: hypothetical protein VJU80_04180 [Solirubrobacteraceae bacterium]|nr:hypothetical protein [Solirubrobacteraceae bacterium]
MSITHRSSTNLGCAGGNPLVRRWCETSRGIRKRLAGIRHPRLRADIQRLIDAYWTGRALEATPPLEGRAQALAAVCEALLRQFDDRQVGAAEIRLVVHKRETEPVSAPRLDPDQPVDTEGEELLWELRRLLASSGGTIADVAHALERRGDEVDSQGRALLKEEVGAIEVDIAVLKTLLSDPIDWDAESMRLLAGEVPPFEEHVVDDDEDDEDD